MSSVWEVVSLDPWDTATIQMPLYLLSICNRRCWAGPDDGVVIMFNKVTGHLKLGNRGYCGS